jgi:hypothetical protein
MNNASHGAPDVVRDQQDDRLDKAAVGLNVVKPFFEYQTLVLRLWANNCELLALNYQRSVETFADDLKRNETRRRDAA